MGKLFAPRDRLYIIPTRYGMIWLSIIVMMVMAGSASGNNLVFMVAFILLAIFMMAMLATHRNLKDLNVQFQSADDSFLKEPGQIWLNLSLKKSSSSENIQIVPRNQRDRWDQVTPVSMNSGESRLILCNWRPLRRGVHQIPDLNVSTVYPLGLFVCWRSLKLSGQVYIYPEKKGDLPLPMAVARGFAHEERGALLEGGPEDFHEHRLVQPGDPLHRVDWKVYARTRTLLSKHFAEPAPQRYRFDWHDVKPTDVEDKLSQLAKWVDQAFHEHATFELILPQAKYPSGEGALHRRACLRALATFNGVPS